MSLNLNSNRNLKIDIRRKILIVEDEADLITYYSYVLSDDYKIITASSGNCALKHIKDLEDVHLAIIDYKLPDISGIEILKRIKNTRPSIPVIIVTAYGDEEVALKSFRYGAKDYIKKPFSLNELMKKIEFLLSLQLKQGDSRKLLYTEDDLNKNYQPSINSKMNGKIQEAILYIQENYRAKINIDTVASVASLSKYHFSRMFKKIIGISYRNYLNNIRIEKAKEMLQNSRLSITEIAFSVGHNDLTNFERIFKKKVGCAPSEYKNTFVTRH